jgi:mutator protein MutT
MNKIIEVSVAAIIIKNRKVLLEKRGKIKEGNKWCLPGGHVDYGEKAEHALKREVKEELGLITKNIKFLGYFDEIIPRINTHALVLVYRTNISGKVKIQKKEVENFDWFTKKEFSRLNIAFKHKEIINRYFGSK